MTHASASKEPFSARFELSNRPQEIADAERSLLGAIEQLCYDRASVFAIRLALEEGLNNAFRHGNRGDLDKKVQLTCRVDAEAVLIEIEDQGDGFDPQSVPDPTEQENLEIPAGRGLTLMRAFMTEVLIPPPGNRVRMKYLRPQA